MKYKNPTSTRLALPGFIVITALSLSSAFAGTWTGTGSTAPSGGANLNFFNTANWSDTTVPTTITGGTAANFTTIAGNTTVGTVTFNADWSPTGTTGQLGFFSTSALQSSTITLNSSDSNVRTINLLGAGGTSASAGFAINKAGSTAGVNSTTNLLTIGSNLSLNLAAGLHDFNVSGGSGGNARMTIDGKVTGTGGGMAFRNTTGTGSAIFDLNNTTNDFTGLVSVHGSATLAFKSIGNSGAASALGAGSAITLGANTGSTGAGILAFNGTGNQSSNKTITVVTNGDSVIRNNATDTSTLTLTGNITSSQSNGGATSSIRFGGNASGQNEVSGVIGGGTAPTFRVQVGGSNNDAANWKFSNVANTYNGSTNLLVATGGSAPKLEVTKLADGGQNSSIGTSSNAAANLLLGNGSILTYTGSGDSTDRLFTINGTSAGHSATINASGDGAGDNALNFTNTGNLAYGTNNQTRTLRLGGTNTDNNSLSATLIDNGSGALSVTKQDAGTWNLTGNNTYQGVTSVTGGKLQVNGTHINSSAGSNYAVTNADSTLGGTGRLAINGNVSVGSGAYLSPGASIGTLTLDGANTVGNVLTMTTGSKFAFELAGNGGTPDHLDFWNYAAGDLVLNMNTIDLSLLGTQSAGTYNVDLFRFFSNGGTTAAIHNFVSGLTIGTLGASISSASIDWNGTGDNSQTIALTYTVVPEPNVATLIGGLGTLLILRRRRK